MPRQLSIFIDESGDFGGYQPHSPYYLVVMLFLDQKDSILDAVGHLDTKMKALRFESHALHTGPLIRREKDYLHLSIDERKSLFTALIHFCRHVDVKYSCLHVEKKNCSGIIDLTARLSKQIHLLVDRNLEFFQSYDEIIVYYDNGQIELTRVLTSTLSVLLGNVTFRKVNPSEYKLFQLADMFCSLELTAIKFETNTATQSELEFFKSRKQFTKDYLKKIRCKRLESTT
jgi:hypothetical protein